MKPRNSSLIKESHIFFLILNKAALILYKTNIVDNLLQECGINHILHLQFLISLTLPKYNVPNILYST